MVEIEHSKQFVVHAFALRNIARLGVLAVPVYGAESPQIVLLHLLRYPIAG